MGGIANDLLLHPYIKHAVKRAFIRSDTPDIEPFKLFGKSFGFFENHHFTVFRYSTDCGICSTEDGDSSSMK